jgi:hypothetical protein
MLIVLGHKDLTGDVKKIAGIAGTNAGRSGCTPSWSRLQSVGLTIAFNRGYRTILVWDDNDNMSVFSGNLDDLIDDADDEDEKSNRPINDEKDEKRKRPLISMKPFTDSVEMLIRQGGIKEGNLCRDVNTMFREDVFPSIKKFIPDLPNVFKLNLHFNNNLLMEAELNNLK